MLFPTSEEFCIAGPISEVEKRDYLIYFSFPDMPREWFSSFFRFCDTSSCICFKRYIPLLEQKNYNYYCNEQEDNKD